MLPKWQSSHIKKGKAIADPTSYPLVVFVANLAVTVKERGLMGLGL